jgi:hypothetical protein
LTLSTGGTLSGTPTAGGTFTFTITATDSSTGTGPYTGSQAYTVTITINLALSPTTLPNGARNTAYSQTLSASGGTAPYTFAKTTGTLPAGLTLSSGGLLSGRPTANNTQYTFTITVTDSANPQNTGSQSYTMTA